MRTDRLVWLAAIGLLTLALAQCGGGSSTPTSPSPSPSPTPSPTPTPAPSPSPGGNSLSISPQTIQSQGQPQATVTLASAAPVRRRHCADVEQRHLGGKGSSLRHGPGRFADGHVSRRHLHGCRTYHRRHHRDVRQRASMAAMLTVIPAGSGAGLGRLVRRPLPHPWNGRLCSRRGLAGP